MALKNLLVLFFSLIIVLSTLTQIVFADVVVPVTITIKDAEGNIFYENVYVVVKRTRTLWPDEKIWEGYINGSRTINLSVTSDSKYHFDVRYPLGSKGNIKYVQIRYPSSKDGDFPITGNFSISIVLPVVEATVKLNNPDARVTLIGNGLTINLEGNNTWSGYIKPGTYQALIEVPEANYKDKAEVELHSGQNIIQVNIEKWAVAKIVNLDGTVIKTTSPTSIVIENRFIKIVIDKVDHELQIYLKQGSGWTPMAYYNLTWWPKGTQKRFVFKGIGPEEGQRYTDFNWSGWEGYHFISFPMFQTLKDHIVVQWYNIVITRPFWQDPKFWDMVKKAALILAVVVALAAGAVVAYSALSSGLGLGTTLIESLKTAGFALLGRLWAPVSAALEIGGKTKIALSLLALASKVGLAMAGTAIAANYIIQFLKDQGVIQSGDHAWIGVMTIDVTPMTADISFYNYATEGDGDFYKQGSGGSGFNRSYVVKSYMRCDMPRFGNLDFSTFDRGIVQDTDSAAWEGWDDYVLDDLYVIDNGEYGKFALQVLSDFGDSYHSSGLEGYYPSVKYLPNSVFFAPTCNRISISPCFGNFTGTKYGNHLYAVSNLIHKHLAHIDHNTGVRSLHDDGKDYNFESIALPDVTGAVNVGRFGMFPAYEIQNYDFSMTWSTGQVIIPVFLLNRVKGDLVLYSNPPMTVYAATVKLEKGADKPLWLEILPTKYGAISFKQYWNVGFFNSLKASLGLTDPGVYIDSFGHQIPLNDTNYPSWFDLTGDWVGKQFEYLRNMWSSFWNSTYFWFYTNPLVKPFTYGVDTPIGHLSPQTVLAMTLIPLGLLLLFIFFPSVFFALLAVLSQLFSFISGRVSRTKPKTRGRRK